MAQRTLAQTETTPLLRCGILAGPLFIGTWLVQALTRDGFDPTRHPMSLLSLGDLGAVQIINFVLSGLLFVTFAKGVRRALGGVWAPLSVALMGIGLVVAGVFTTDPGAGFPAGAPEGAPARMSWHGVLHEVGFALTALSWIVSCFVFARVLRQRRWAIAPLVMLVVVAWPDVDSLSMRLVTATAIQFAVTALIAAHLIRARPARSRRP